MNLSGGITLGHVANSLPTCFTSADVRLEFPCSIGWQACVHGHAPAQMSAACDSHANCPENWQVTVHSPPLSIRGFTVCVTSHPMMQQ